MIYDQNLTPIRLLRRARLDDVRRFFYSGMHAETPEDGQAAADGSYIFAKLRGVTDPQVIHLSFLRADGGDNEILQALRELPSRAGGHRRLAAASTK
jgi:hypothetical protein